MNHLHPWPRFWRRLFGLAPKPCEPLDFSGGGCVRACLLCIFESKEFAHSLAGIKQIRQGAQE